MGRYASGLDYWPFLYNMGIWHGYVLWPDGMYISRPVLFFFAVDARRGCTSQEELLVFFTCIILSFWSTNRPQMGMHRIKHCHMVFQAIAFPHSSKQEFQHA